VRIYYSTKFAKEYKKLPNKIKIVAEKKELIFRQNLFDSRLRTHRLTGKLKNFWSFSINYKHRIIFEIVDEKIIWFHSVGTHRIYQ
jgi:addiction module RelE/StbE family toxin